MEKGLDVALATDLLISMLWLISVALIIIGELVASPIMMMVVTVSFVISTAALCATGVVLGATYSMIILERWSSASAG